METDRRLMEGTKIARVCKNWVHDYQGWGHCPIYPQPESLLVEDACGDRCSSFKGACIYCGSQTKHTAVCPDNSKYWPT